MVSLISAIAETPSPVFARLYAGCCFTADSLACVVLEWQAKGARLVELLDYARLRPLAHAALQERLI